METALATELLNRVSNLPESTLETIMWTSSDDEACEAAGPHGYMLRAAAREWDIDCSAMAEMGLTLKHLAQQCERMNAETLRCQKEKELRAERYRAQLASYPEGAELY